MFMHQEDATRHLEIALEMQTPMGLRAVSGFLCASVGTWRWLGDAGGLSWKREVMLSVND